MSRQDPKAGGHKKLVANRFSVATQSHHVATTLRLLHHSSISVVSKSVATVAKSVAT